MNGSISKADRHNPLGIVCIPFFALLPLCLCFLGSAFVLALADLLRRQDVADDGLLPPLFACIHPAVLLLLLLGYAAAIGIAIGVLRSARRPEGE